MKTLIYVLLVQLPTGNQNNEVIDKRVIMKTTQNIIVKCINTLDNTAVGASSKWCRLDYRIEMRANLNDSKMHRTTEQIKTDKKLNSRKHYEIDKEITKKYNDISKVAKAYYAKLEHEQNDTNYMSYDDVV